MAFAFVTQGFAGLLLQGTVPAPGDGKGGIAYYEPAPAPAPQIPSIIEPTVPPVGQGSSTNDVRFVFADDVQPNPLDNLVVSVQDAFAANASLWQSVNPKGSMDYVPPTTVSYTPPPVYTPAQAAPPIVTSPFAGAPLDGFLETPEPATFGYFALALAGLAIGRRRLAR